MPDPVSTGAILGAAGITTLGNFFGGLLGGSPEGAYVAPSDARFAYLNLEKFNPDSGAVAALQQSKTKLAQMKANKLGYIQQQYNQQRAAGGIGGHQLVGSLGLMGSQFASLINHELELDARIASEMDVRNQSELQKLAAQQQAILTPSKDGKQKFGTEGQRLSDDYLAWTKYQQDGGELDFETWRSQQGGPQGSAAQDAWAAWQQSHPGSSMTFENWYNQIYSGPGGGGGGVGGDGSGGDKPPGSGFQGDPTQDPQWASMTSEFQQKYKDYLAAGGTESPTQFMTLDPSGHHGWDRDQSAGFTWDPTGLKWVSGGGPSSGGGNFYDLNPIDQVSDSGTISDGQFVKDPIAPTGGKGTVSPTGAAPIIKAEDLMAPVNSQGQPAVDPMVFPKYNQPKEKLNFPIDDNLLAMYKQGLLEM